MREQTCFSSVASVDKDGASAIVRQEHPDRHFILGGLGNHQFGIYMINKSRSENGTDGQAYMDENGDWVSGGRILPETTKILMVDISREVITQRRNGYYRTLSRISTLLHRLKLDSGMVGDIHVGRMAQLCTTLIWLVGAATSVILLFAICGNRLITPGMSLIKGK